MREITASYLVETLGKESHAPIHRMNKASLTVDEQAEVQVLERITSFGQDSIDLFDNMLQENLLLPTQREYCEEGVELMVTWIRENRPEIPITKVLREACKLRLTRTYMSKCTEIHLEAVIKEELPHLTVRTANLLDSVMGVDIVLEDDKKRYYVHVTSNTAFAQKMLIEKEDRGGLRVGNSYKRYSRDFTGDVILKYDVYKESATTMLINGFPLFKPEYISDRFAIARIQPSKGELLSVPYSKLQHFKDWAGHLGLNIEGI